MVGNKILLLPLLLHFFKPWLHQDPDCRTKSYQTEPDKKRWFYLASWTRNQAGYLKEVGQLALVSGVILSSCLGLGVASPLTYVKFEVVNLNAKKIQANNTFHNSSMAKRCIVLVQFISYCTAHQSWVK